MRTALGSRFLARSFSCLAALVLLVSAGPEASLLKAEGYAAFIERMLQWGEYIGIFAVGWGMGASLWVTTAHQALRCLLFDLPRGWTLWQDGVLTSFIPASKYLVGGVLFLGAWALLIIQLMGAWNQGLYVGAVAGAIAGVCWSLETEWKEEAVKVEFLLRNRSYVDEDKVPMFRHVD
jgi:hypothetical protein